jgi:hypothetical protein
MFIYQILVNPFPLFCVLGVLFSCVAKLSLEGGYLPRKGGNSFRSFLNLDIL